MLKQILGRLQTLEQNVGKKIESLDDKVDKLAIEVGKVHDRVAAVDSKLKTMTMQLKDIEDRFDRITQKVENRDSEYNERFLKIEQAVAELRKLMPPSAPKAKKKAR